MSAFGGDDILAPSASLRFAHDGAELHAEIWEPQKPEIKGTLYHCHGIAESNETASVQRLARAGTGA